MTVNEMDRSKYDNIRHSASVIKSMCSKTFDFKLVPFVLNVIFFCFLSLKSWMSNLSVFQHVFLCILQAISSIWWSSERFFWLSYASLMNRHSQGHFSKIWWSPHICFWECWRDSVRDETISLCRWDLNLKLNVYYIRFLHWNKKTITALYLLFTCISKMFSTTFLSRENQSLPASCPKRSVVTCNVSGLSLVSTLRNSV